jgi:ribosome-binding factor A
MPEAKRRDRVGEEFREVLAEEIPKLKDPRVGFVTVLGVDVSPDLRRALVHYTVMGEDKDRKATRAALRSASGHLRRVIGREVRLRVLPDLEFMEAAALAGTDRVDELLEKIKEEDAGS